MKEWLARHRIALFAAAVILLYACFVEWAWGWAAVAAAWRGVGAGAILLSIALLVVTHLVRAHRMLDYFPEHASGHFFRLFRVTQIHNLLNIMLPFRAGETSFPLLMRSEFGVPLAHGASALLVLRLLDLHALLAAAGVGLVAGRGFAPWAVLLWLVFLLLPLFVFPLRNRVEAALEKVVPARFHKHLDAVMDGVPPDLDRFLRAWFLTVLNWGIKVLVLAWILGLMGVTPVSATFGGALGGELSSVLPAHAPAGVGTYPAGIAAGALAFGAERNPAALDLLARASINLHLLMIVSALAGTALSLVLPDRRRKPG